MPMINTGNDLTEILMTEEELFQAKTFASSGLALAMLQNTKVQIVRRLAYQELEDPLKDVERIRERAYLKGQLDLLDTLCTEAINAQAPVPSTQPVQPN